MTFETKVREEADKMDISLVYYFLMLTGIATGVETLTELFTLTHLASDSPKMIKVTALSSMLSSAGIALTPLILKILSLHAKKQFNTKVNELSASHQRTASTVNETHTVSLFEGCFFISILCSFVYLFTTLAEAMRIVRAEKLAAFYKNHSGTQKKTQEKGRKLITPITLCNIVRTCCFSLMIANYNRLKDRSVSEFDNNTLKILFAMFGIVSTSCIIMKLKTKRLSLERRTLAKIYFLDTHPLAPHEIVLWNDDPEED